MSAALLVVLLVGVLRLLLCLRQWRQLRAQPDAAYAAAQLHGLCAGGVAHSLLALLLLALLMRLPSGGVVVGVSAIVGLAALQRLPDLAVTAWQRLRIDPRFGRAAATLPEQVRSAARQLAIRALLALLVGAVAIGSLHWLGAGWWWPLLPLAALLARPLEQAWRGMPAAPATALLRAGPELEQQLQRMLQRSRQAKVSLRIEPASRQSPHANARAEQCGARRRVILLDTLVAQLPAAEVVAVLAHELGHLAHGHLRRRSVLLLMVWGVALALAATLVPYTGDWRGIVALWLVAQSLRFLLQPPVTACLRRWELEADAFAAAQVPATTLAAALRRLLQVNATPAAADRWFAAFHHPHPPLQQRLQRLNAA